MQFENINPFVRQALAGALNKSNSQDVYTKIKTVDSRMFYIISGGGTMTIENIHYPISRGTVILFAAGTEYIWGIDDVRYYSVNFDYTHDFSNIKNTFHPIHSSVFENNQIIHRAHFEDMTILNKPLVIDNVPLLEPTFKQIITEYCMADRYADPILSSLMKAVIFTVVRMSASKSRIRERPTASLARSIIEYVNVNYSSPVSNESIAEHFHFSSAYLNRTFKAYTGSTMHEFLISRRLSAAMEMLRSQNIPIGEVAFRCGFQTLHHFSKTFKKHVKMSPASYRKYNI